jgi:hypothetical protein
LKVKEKIKPIFRALLVKRKVKLTVQTEFAIEYVISAMTGIISYWYKNKEAITIEEVLTLLYKVTKEGAANML